MLFIQVLGFIAFIFFFASYIFKNKENIVWFQLISYMIFSIHYLLLGAFTGSLLELGCVGSSIATNYHSNNKKIYSIILIAIYIVIAIISWESWYSLIPTIVCIFTTLSLFYGNAFTLRLVGLVNSLGWGIYSYFVKSYVGVVTNSFLIIFILICIIMRRKNEK